MTKMSILHLAAELVDDARPTVEALPGAASSTNSASLVPLWRALAARASVPVMRVSRERSAADRFASRRGPGTG